MQTWIRRHSKLYRMVSRYFITLRQFLHPYPQRKTFFQNSRSILLAIMGLILVIGLSVKWGYQLAYSRFLQNETAEAMALSWEDYLKTDRQQLTAALQQSENHLQILTQHIGRIEANLIRINTLGERLVRYVALNPEEFNFKEIKHDPLLQRNALKDDSLSILRELDNILERRYIQMTTLQQALEEHRKQNELAFPGIAKVVTNGWISSFFGLRHDPFTGKKAWHNGVDIVGKEGSEIKALASGMVSFADVKGSYGQLVEINHGNGLMTRYGHNKQVLVQKGQLVRKGQTIALLGSTGRSTGPHLHLEVHKDGQPVDPGHYFSDFKRTS